METVEFFYKKLVKLMPILGWVSYSTLTIIFLYYLAVERGEGESHSRIPLLKNLFMHIAYL